MKKYIAVILSVLLVGGIFSACGKTESETEGVQIKLSDSKVTVDGAEATDNIENDVYVANDIVYYEDGHDFTYGEGTEADAHTKDEASAHTVVHITKSGNYTLSGKMTKGQIAIDLGEEAKDNPDAVVNLTLSDIDITCEVAPAIIFYNVYECSDTTEENASATVDTSKAGANVIIADGTENTVNGSYVAKIYKPDSVVLNSEKTEVEDADKLHKYDGAFYSRMSMNINGGERGDGRLNINAENEGLDSEMHLTINSGNIIIESGNDGINTNEDNISVTTINGGALNILVNGKTGEGDGIDSNGWLVINGGTLLAQGCATSGDAGIDSDKGIHLNGGTVFATGNMLDRISESKQTFAVFSFDQKQDKGVYSLKNSENTILFENNIENSFTYLVVSCKELAAGEYTLWNGTVQLEGIKSQGSGGGMMQAPPQGGTVPEGMEPPEKPEGMTLPEGMTIPEGMERPENIPPRGELPDGETPPQKPDGEFPQMPDGGQRPDRNPQGAVGEKSSIFTITDGENYFNSVSAAE